MASKFGGVAVEEEPKSKFGGVPVEEPTTATSKPRGQVFWETIGGQALQDMIGGASRDPEKAKKALDTFKGLVHGIADEPARVWDQLSKSGEAMTRGDIPAAASHLGGAVPFIGGTAREVQHDVEKGNYLDAAERAAGIALPLAAPKIPAMAKAAAPALDATGAALKGAAKGAFNEATSTVDLHRHYVPITVPKVAATASLGAAAFRAVGLPHEAGAVIGAAAPIIRAAYKGGREALRERLLTPAAPPPGFGIAEGSTAPTLTNLSPATPTAQLVNQPTSQFRPPVGGVFPGTEVPGVAPPEVASPAPGFGVASGSTASPIAVTPPPTPGYQPPVSGALPNVAPEAAPVGASMPVAPPASAAVADAGGLATERASSLAGPSPEILDQIARSQAGKRFNRLFPQEQQIVRRIAERMSQPTAAMASETPQSLAAPPEVAPQQTAAPTPGNSAEIAAALRDEMVRSGTIAPEAAQPVGGTPDPTGLADLMRELPQGTKKEVAKSNYRAVKEGASSPETAGPAYEAAGRATKVDPVVKAILDHGFTYSDIIRLTKTQIKDLADKLSKATAAEGGQHPGHAFSALSVDEMIGQLRMAEDAAKKAAKPASK